ncbi:MAG: hypothetical protein KJ749_03580 [Planctomycetes bacterium]|nr:hypothetical protein [Planctomycetota bacterium]
MSRVRFVVLSLVAGVLASACSNERSATVEALRGAESATAAEDQADGTPVAQDSSAGKPADRPTPKAEQVVSSTKSSTASSPGRSTSEGQQNDDPAVEAVEKELVAKWNKIRSLSAHATVQVAQYSEDAEFWLDGDGTYDCKVADGKLLIRLFLENWSVQQRGSNEAQRYDTRLTVVDGEYKYVLTDSAGRYDAEKSTSEPADMLQLGGQAIFDELHRQFTVELLPTDNIDGRDAYVFGCSPTTGCGKAYYYFDRDTGVMLKMHLIADETDTVTRGIELRDLQIDPDLSDELFVFSPPDGVRVIDRTRMQQMQRFEAKPVD